MLLPVEGTLEAAEIEVNPHERMIPDAVAFWVLRARPARGPEGVVPSAWINPPSPYSPGATSLENSRDRLVTRLPDLPRPAGEPPDLLGQVRVAASPIGWHLSSPPECIYAPWGR